MSAVPALILLLKDKVAAVRGSAAEALGKMGDSQTLPRKILNDSRITVRKRIELLETLHNAYYKDGGRTVSYDFADTRVLCQVVLTEENAETRKGALAVFHWLNGDRNLVIASERSQTTEPRELVRPAEGRTSEPSRELLLRASDESEQDAEPHPTQPSPWKRLFKKRKDAAF